MGWLERFSTSNAGPAGDAGDLTIANGRPFGDGGGIPDALAVPDGSGPSLSEGIKRRQVALLLRYVMTVRAR